MSKKWQTFFFFLSFLIVCSARRGKKKVLNICFIVGSVALRIKHEEEKEQIRLYKSFAQQVLQHFAQKRVKKKIIIAAVLKEFDATELIRSSICFRPE